MSHIDDAAIALGRDQYGLVHRRQFSIRRIDSAAVNRRIETGVWAEHGSVVDLRSHPDTGRQRVMRSRLESPLEVDGLRFLRWAGVPPFVLQHPIRDDDGVLISRADAAWPRRLVALYLDSRTWHDAPSDRAADTSERARVKRLGWTVIVLRAADLRPPRRQQTRRDLLRSLA